MTVSWLLCDYGEVLSQPQPEDEVTALAALAGVPRERWDEVYWRHRPAFDEGALSALTYWEDTLGRQLDPGLVDELVALDVGAWLHPVPDALAAAEASGRRLAVLSNAPHCVADALDEQPWIQAFEPRLFSARLGVAKPDPRTFEAALAALGAAPEDVRFVDDRVANVDAADAMGIDAVLYRGDAAVLREPGRG